MTAAAQRSLDTKGNKSRVKENRRTEYDNSEGRRWKWTGDQIRHNRALSSLLSQPYLFPLVGGLAQEDLDIVGRTAEQLAACSTVQFVGVTPDGREIVQDTYSCHSRFCSICAHQRSKKVQKRMNGWYVGGKTVLDGRGKMAGNRTKEEITQWMVSRVELLSAQNRLPESQTGLEEALGGLLLDGEAELEKQETDLHWHFITLTVPNIPHLFERDPEGLEVNWLDKMILEPWRKMWNASRQRRRAKKNSKRKARIPGLDVIAALLGYMGRLEITYNRRTKEFHPHIHLLALSDRRWLPYDLILRAWQHFTSQETKVIDVRAADPATVGKELVKYVTKTADVAGDPNAAKELARALYGRRTLFTGGAMFGVRWSEEIAQWGQEMAYIRESPAEGHHVRRRWDPSTERFEYEILRQADSDDPIKSQLQRQRVTTGDGERATAKYRDTGLDRMKARTGRLNRHTDSESEWKKMIMSDAKAKFQRYWAQPVIQYAYEWLLVGILSAIAAPAKGWELGTYRAETDLGDTYHINCEEGPCAPLLRRKKS